MDKYEYKVRADEIRALIAEGDYAKAAEIADTIDWRRVKSVMMLCTISDLYKINRRYEDSRDILLLAYEKGGGRRPIVYSLCELSIKLEEYVKALEYYKEFVTTVPGDSGRYVLQYKLYEAQEVSLEERIAVLEELKRKDYREKWAYELAYLYHRVGLESKCVEECDEMYLWFQEGRYVQKALELKKLHQPLTDEQEIRYELMKQNGANSILTDYITESQSIKAEAATATEDEEDNEFSKAQNVLTDPTQELPGKEVEDIQVKTVDVSQYNTVNLQRELAESMKEFLEPGQEEEEQEDKEPSAEENDEIVEEITEEVEPQYVEPRQDTDEMQLISVDMLTAEEPSPENPVSQEVFFGNTEEVNVGDVVSELVEKDAETSKAIASMQESVSKVAERNAVTPQNPMKLAVASPDPALSNTGVIRTFHKPSGYDDMLSQEYDGQISLVVPEQEQVEKQITGQLSIDDVVAEWERMKKENEQKMLREIKERVHKQTDSLFADFDESTKSGLLQELEKAMVDAAIKESKLKAEAERPKVIKVADIEKGTAKKVEKPEIEEETEKEIPTPEPEPVLEVVAEKEEIIPEPEISEEIEEVEPDLEETEVMEDTEIDVEIEAEPEPVEEVSEDELVSEQEENLEDETEDAKEDTEDSATEETAEADEEDNLEEASEEAEEKKTTVRDMNKSEREQFAPFIHHKKTRRQIVEAIDHISMASYTGNVVITGEEGTGTTALAKLLVKEIQLSDDNFSGKVAKISGSNMNKKEVGETLGKLGGGALIVENASAMKRATAQALEKELNQEEKGLVVLLTDKKDAMEKFLKKNEELTDIFNLRVDVEALDDQTLVKYAKKYALDQEYSIDELGILALHTRIADMQTSNHEVTMAEIEELVDEAIYYADKKTPKHFFDVLFGKRYDEDDMIVLREKDFMHN